MTTSNGLQLRDSLLSLQPKFEALLPSHITAERFIQTALTAVRKNPNLINPDKCSRASLFNELMDCAKDGLIPDGREAVIVTFRGHAKYMPMVLGICKTARNSGEIALMDGLVVYENDFYESWVDETGPHFKHKRSYKDRGKPLLTYAYVRTMQGNTYMEEIDEGQMADIEEVATRNKKITPWFGPFKDEMKRKSALRRLLKYRVPLSTDLINMMAREDDLYGVEPEETQEETQKDSPIVPTKLENVLSEQDGPSPEEDSVPFDPIDETEHTEYNENEDLI